jgi:zinc-ribbon domain
MFCASCGASVSDDHAFCSSCGRPTQKPLATPESQDRIETIEAHPVSAGQTQHDTPPTTQYQPMPAPPPPAQQSGGSPVYVTQQVQVASPVLIRAPKSVGLAVLLAILFGPFGLFYASVLGGIVMLIGGIIAVAVTYGIAAPFVWITCAVWAGIAASNYNRAIAGYASPTQINRH